MGFIDSNLMNEEKIVYQAKLHWIVFRWTILALVVTVAMLISGSMEAVISGLLWSLILGTLNFLKYKTSEIGVTNKRVMIKVGLIKRHSLETLLNKVEGIQVNQSILGRVLGYGTIVVTGTGGTREPFPMIAAPLDFRKFVQEQISAG